MTSLPELGQRAKQASLALALASSLTKDAALHAAADLSPRAHGRDPGRQCRRRRPGRARAASRRPSSTGCACRRPGWRPWPTGLRQVAGLADPVGEVVEGWVRPNGLRIEKVRVPLGRRGHHLREPAQRDQRRRRPVPEVGQRRLPAGQLRPPWPPTRPSPRALREGFAKAGPARGLRWCWWRTRATSRPGSSCACGE